MVQRRVHIAGRVQGVGFRFGAAREAERLGGLRGFVRNLEDGRVEAVVAGPEREVLALVAWCSRGPVSARVERLEVVEEAVDASLSAFRVG